MSVDVVTTDAATTSGRDADLWHVCHLDNPDRALCGMTLGSEIVPYDASVAGGECVVCEDLAERFIEGSWSP